MCMAQGLGLRGFCLPILDVAESFSSFGSPGLEHRALRCGLQSWISWKP